VAWIPKYRRKKLYGGIAKYIREQEAEDKRLDQLELFKDS
jgi:hypothetical protein